MAKVEEIQVGDYWLDNDGKPRLVKVVLPFDGQTTIYVSCKLDRLMDLLHIHRINPKLLIKKIEKTEAIKLFVEMIQEKVQEIDKFLELDLKVTFSAEQESASDKGGT